MAIIIGLALGLIIAGLVIAYLSGTMRQALLESVLYWVGVVLVVVGLVLLVAPVVAWLDAQLRSMLKL